MNKKLIVILLTVCIIIALIFGAKWIQQFLQVDSCLDRGGRWNYELNECEEYYDINKENLSYFYWKSDYDTVHNREILKKGRLVDSYRYLGETVFTLTENDLIRFVEIELDSGSHSSPGIYNRNDFKDLVK